MVKILKSKNLVAIATILTLMSSLFQNSTAQSTNDMSTFLSKDYIGISVGLDATRETIPGKNFTAVLLIKCTSLDVTIEYLNISILGFRYAKEKTRLMSILQIDTSTPLVFNCTDRYNHTIYVPADVWDLTHCELNIQYTVADETLKRSEIFPITYVRNVYLEQLEDMFNSLNNTYWLLNQTFWRSFRMNLTQQNLDILNKTYWELQQNYTSFQTGHGELENTRLVVVILATTTIFFVASTLYLVMKRPKQYW